MFEGYVCNRAVTTYEVRTLAMDMEQIYGKPNQQHDVSEAGAG